MDFSGNLKGQRGFSQLAILILGFVFLVGTYKYLSANNYFNSKVTTKNTTSAQLDLKSSESTVSAQVNQEKIKKYLTVEAALLGLIDNSSIYYKDISDGTSVNFDSERSWIPASTIKAFVVLEAFRQRRVGLLDFNQTVQVSAQNVVPTELETDEFPRLREGTSVTVKQLVEAMIIQSDNTAYNTLLDVLDRRNINQTLKDLGLTETVVGEKLNLDDNQEAGDQLVPGRQANTTTAKDYAFLFDLLANRKVPESDEILAIFKRQKINNMIPALLPKDTAIAHKTGDWAPIYHDGGIVYKGDHPYILTVFTNSNDPNTIAKLSRVAYYQSAEVIGASLPIQESMALKTPTQSDVTTLKNQDDVQVLGVTNNDTPFPNVTAADLGITAKDLNLDSEDTSKLSAAFINPGSLLYGIKRYLQDNFLSPVPTDSKSSGAKVDGYLKRSENRLSEVKSLIAQGDIAEAKNALQESEADLKQAVDVSTSDQAADVNLVKVKKTSDLSFAVLADSVQNLPPDKKDQFIDMVYDFYNQNSKEVKSVVKTSLIANPIQQEPIIGTVKSVKDNVATLEFEDGTTKDVVITDNTPVRQFGKTELESNNGLPTGTKVAVIGQTNKNGIIIPTFVMKNVPQVFPNKTTGTVIEIDPSQNILKIKDSKGQDETVHVDEAVIKGKDTDVSVGGIKAGSQVTIYGVVDSSSGSVSTPTTKLIITTDPEKKPSNSAPAKPATSNNVDIKATTVTVTKNSSGALEQKTNHSPQAGQSPSAETSKHKK